MRARGRVLLQALLAGAMSLAVTAAGRVPQPAYEVDKSTTCVAPPAEMRRTHMDLLKHRRDQTVHAGVRGGKTSLETCIDCHAGKAGGAVTGRPDAFCEACHAYAGVRLDCFECHQSKRGAATVVSGAQGPSR
ncbi:MAG TPA: hypothetical protein VLW55_12375 [Burkholderiaceae bacterium]|nr:hypothetical protein [Burkholderiaceae bacterium]